MEKLVLEQKEIQRAVAAEWQIKPFHSVDYKIANNARINHTFGGFFDMDLLVCKCGDSGREAIQRVIDTMKKELESIPEYISALEKLRDENPLFAEKEVASND